MKHGVQIWEFVKGINRFVSAIVSLLCLFRAVSVFRLFGPNWDILPEVLACCLFLLFSWCIVFFVERNRIDDFELNIKRQIALSWFLLAQSLSLSMLLGIILHIRKL